MQREGKAAGQGCTAAKKKQRQRLTRSSGSQVSSCLRQTSLSVGVDPLVLGCGDGAPMKLLLELRTMKSTNSWLSSCRLVLCDVRARNLPSICPQQHSTPSWRVLLGSSLYFTNWLLFCSIRGLRSCLTTWRTISADTRLYWLPTRTAFRDHPAGRYAQERKLCKLRKSVRIGVLHLGCVSDAWTRLIATNPHDAIKSLGDLPACITKRPGISSSYHPRKALP